MVFSGGLALQHKTWQQIAAEELPRCHIALSSKTGISVPIWQSPSTHVCHSGTLLSSRAAVTECQFENLHYHTVFRNTTQLSLDGNIYFCLKILSLSMSYLGAFCIMCKFGLNI